jgi:hypothetical protein
VASPYVHVRMEPRLHERVVAAAEAEGLTISGWLRRAALDRLDDTGREAAERAALLAEARRFLAVPAGPTAADRDAYSLVDRYVKAIEAQAGRLSLAEQRGRTRALQEIAQGALEPLDGAELTLAEFRPDGPPVTLELAATPRRRGFLKAALAAERARALLQALPSPEPPPSAAGLLGEQRTRELWTEAIGWPG